MTNAELLDGPWRVKLHVERVPTGWSIAAEAWAADDDSSPADAFDHEWWVGLSAGGTTRWHSSSAARSEHGLVDDPPAIDALWVKATGATEVVVDCWIRLRDESGDTVERAYRARHVVSTAGSSHIALAVVDGWQRPSTAAVTTIEPHERVELPSDHVYAPTAVVPGMGLLESDRDGWALTGTGGRTPLRGFVPGGAPRLEAITTSHDGRVAVVWTIDQRWHLALYQLPATTPLAMIAPRPSANGNTPHPGKFLDGGLALLPVGFDEIGIVDAARGEVRHRLSAGGYVRDVGLDGDGTRVWIAGHGHARCYDAETGALLEDHPMPDSYGRATAFDARARRAYSYDVFDYDDGVSALGWYDLDGTMGQLLVPDTIEHTPVPVDGGVVALGRAGLWYADVDRGQLARVTGPLYLGCGTATQPVAAEREGNQLVLWTQDRTHFRVAVSLPPRA